MHFKASTFLAPNFHKFYAVVQIFSFLLLFGTNLHKFYANFSITILKMNAEVAPSNGAIWDEFSEQH